MLLTVLEKCTAQRERPGTINIRYNEGGNGDEKSVAKTPMVKTVCSKIDFENVASPKDRTIPLSGKSILLPTLDEESHPTLTGGRQIVV